jgi:large subunit ribosomal protein L25
MSILLSAKNRNNTGKKFSRRMRRETNSIPATLFGGDITQKPRSITISLDELSKLIKTSACISFILTLSVENIEEKVIIKNLQRHPVNNKVLHVDFMRVNSNSIVNVLVPIVFLNEVDCPAVKTGGGIISHQKTEIEINCYISNLPTSVSVDMINVPVGGKVHLSDINLPDGVNIPVLRLGVDRDQAIAHVFPRRVS